jgi:hypothetical protein
MDQELADIETSLTTLIVEDRDQLKLMPAQLDKQGIEEVISAP